MKYIREHIMFIFPLMSILLGLESFLVFDRLTQNYEENLKADYSMLVLAYKPMRLSDFQNIDSHISSMEIIKKKAIVDDMAKGMSGTSSADIMGMLPHFYTLRLDSYLNNDALNKIDNKLTAVKNIKSVETFGKNHSSNYHLFIFIKIVLWTFVIFMTITSMFLVIKQMEIWQYSHRERMQVMEIFGASRTLRSGVLFKRAILDAIIATALTNLLFIYLRFVWVPDSHIDMLTQKAEFLFFFKDILTLFTTAMLIVIMAVIMVVLNNKESKL